MPHLARIAVDLLLRTPLSMRNSMHSTAFDAKEILT